MPGVPSLVIVSPALANANNGNGRTAQRWAQALAPRYRVRIANAWGPLDGGGDTLMLALHARRSAASIAAWARAHPGRGLAVVLTGTDLYQDLARDGDARRSLELAQRLVVLQECGADALGEAHRGKTRVVFQSAPAQPPATKSREALDVVMVGHLRAVKSPQTLFGAADLLRGEPGIRFTHIGHGDGDIGLAAQARATARECPNYQWLGALPHAQTMERIRSSHLLVHTSALEGGAHVIMEAVRCGTPVLASEVPGNVGMLGRGYAGYFPHGDAPALAALLRECRAGQSEQDPAASLLVTLAAQCELRAPLFDPAAEREALLSLLQELESAP
ncbi:MAG: putative glycosyltransferase [Ramlibacter sp.]|nr:putative glycosyltransferase [Ramlibacter sp.]